MARPRRRKAERRKARKAKKVKPLPKPKPVEERITRRKFIKKVAVGAGVVAVGAGGYALIRRLFRPRPVIQKTKSFDKRLGEIEEFMAGFADKPSLRKMKRVIESNEFARDLDRIEKELKLLEKRKLTVQEKKEVKRLLSAVKYSQDNLKIVRNGYALNKFVQSKLNDFKATWSRWREIHKLFKEGLTEEGGVIFYFPRENVFRFQRVIETTEKVFADKLDKVEKGDRIHLPAVLEAIRKRPWTNVQLTTEKGRKATVNAKSLEKGLREYLSLMQRKKTARGIELQAIKKRLEAGGFQSMFELLRVQLLHYEYDMTLLLRNMFTEDKYFNPASSQRIYCTFHTHPRLIYQGKRMKKGGRISQKDLNGTFFHGPEFVMEMTETGMNVYLGILGKIVWEKSFKE